MTVVHKQGSFSSIAQFACKLIEEQQTTTVVCDIWRLAERMLRTLIELPESYRTGYLPVTAPF